MYVCMYVCMYECIYVGYFDKDGISARHHSAVAASLMALPLDQGESSCEENYKYYNYLCKCTRYSNCEIELHIKKSEQ